MDNEKLTAYSDADWGSDTDTRRSTTGYIIMSYGGAISWCCKRQQFFFLSSTEAEYMATTSAIQEVIWTRNFIKKILQEELETTMVHCDNKGALSILTNNVFSGRTKHIDIKTRFINEHIESKEVVLKYLLTNCMPADILTKPANANSVMTHIRWWQIF